MKKELLMALAVVLGSSSLAMGNSLTDAQIDNAMTQLERHDMKGVDFIFSNLDGTPTYLMLMASELALRSGRMEDAGFLFYAGMLRLKIDLTTHPPNREDQERDAMILAAVEELGMRLIPMLLSDVRLYSAVIGRLDLWNPVPPPGYNPGWISDDNPSAEEILTIAQKVKGNLLAVPHNVVVLLRNPSYAENLKVVADVLRIAAAGGELQMERMRKAEEVLWEIERESGMMGISASQEEIGLSKEGLPLSLL